MRDNRARKEFEEWYVGRAGVPRETEFCRTITGHYFHLDVHLAWETWWAAWQKAWVSGRIGMN